MHFAAQNVLLAHLFEDCGMCSSQTRNRHTERRAGKVVKAEIEKVTEIKDQGGYEEAVASKED